MLTGCERSRQQLPKEPISRLQSVTPADPAKFPVLQGNKHWSNPYLVVRPESVGLLTDVAANQEQILKPEDVLNALAELPPSAWPYGRAVAILVETKASTSDQEKIALRRNRGLVAGELHSAHIEIDWIPPS